MHRALASRAHCRGGAVVDQPPACLPAQLSCQLADSFESTPQTAARLLEHPVIIRAALAVHRRGFTPTS